MGRGTLTDAGGEDVLVVDLHLYPVHQQVHVLRRRQRRGLLVLVLVLPSVLEPRAAGHHRAALLGAELAHRPVDEVDAVEEVHHVHSHPVVQILAPRQLDRRSQIQPRAQRRLRTLVQLEALRARLEPTLGPERLVLVEHLFESDGHDGSQMERSVRRADDTNEPWVRTGSHTLFRLTNTHG